MVLPNFNHMDWFDGGSYMSTSIEDPQKFKNEFKSFKRRLGKHLYWFDALEDKKQWDLLFAWKRQKHLAKTTNTQVSLKKFLYGKRKSRQFFIPKQKLRESALNNLFN